MTTRSMMRSSVGGLALLLAAACGDSAGGPSYEDVMTSGMAGDIGEWSYYAVPDAFRGMNFGYPMVGIGAPPALLPPGRTPRWELDPRHPETLKAALQAVMADGCTTTASGTDGGVWDPYDGNGNGVADDWSVKVVCVVTDTPSVGVTRVETTEQEMRIKERTQDVFGFDASSRYRSHEVYSDGDDEDWWIEQLHNVSVHSDGATSKFRTRYWQDYLNDGVHNRLDREFAVDLAFDPDGTIAGEAEHLPDGELAITGSAHNLEEGGNFRFEFVTADPWLYSWECESGIEEQPFVDGVLLGLFNGDEDVGFALGWGACGDGNTFDVFGEEAAPPAPGPLMRGYTFPRR